MDPLTGGHENLAGSSAGNYVLNHFPQTAHLPRPPAQCPHARRESNKGGAPAAGPDGCAPQAGNGIAPEEPHLRGADIA